jgi:glucose/arabinose dehydrogenase
MTIASNAWRPRSVVVAVLAVALAGVALVAPRPAPAGAAILPSGFTDSLVASRPLPTALAFTPDGRLLVATQPGRLYTVSNGGSPIEVLNLSGKVCSNSERGLLGVAVDPAFATNALVYLYYTGKTAAGTCPTRETPAPPNRVSRFNLSLATSAAILASEDPLIDGVPSFGGNHNAGDLAFGPDGKLYVSIGDGGCDYQAVSPDQCQGSNDAARDIDIALGKILRINPDGSVPSDNPFVASSTNPCADDGRTDPGVHCPETFAWGFRNPFRMAFAPDGRLLVNDVGGGAWEEIDDVQAGNDYGWNVREGHCARASTTNCGPPPAGMTNPIHDYPHTTGCSSITGAAFVPDTVWPAEYRGDYLFADYICGKIFRLEQGPGGVTVSDFVADLGPGGPVSLEFGPDNALYYTTYVGGGQVRKIAFDASTPGPSPSDVSVSGLSWSSATNGLGPVERDRSNGGVAAGDGGTITLNGATYTNGLGVHAASNIIYPLGRQYVRFRADVGVDDECGSAGSVIFQVYVNGGIRFDSMKMTATSATKAVSVDTTNATELRLKVSNAGDGSTCDHADWAAARLTPASGTTTSTTATTSSTTTSSTTSTSSTTTTTTASPSDVPVSGLSWSSATNGLGPVERDRSNGGAGAGDGGTITLNGATYASGLGVHAPSNVTYALGGAYTRFRADVGVDDECGTAGSVIFQVYVNGLIRFNSNTMTATTATKSVSVDTTGANELRLKVSNAGDGSTCDHADWAAARLTRR